MASLLKRIQRSVKPGDDAGKSDSSPDVPLPDRVITRINKSIQEYRSKTSSKKSLISAVGLAQNTVSTPDSTISKVNHPGQLSNWNIYLADNWKGSSSEKLLYSVSIDTFAWRAYHPVEKSPPVPDTKSFEVPDNDSLLDVNAAFMKLPEDFRKIPFNGVEFILGGFISSIRANDPCWVFFNYEDGGSVIAVNATNGLYANLTKDQIGKWKAVSCSGINHWTGFIPEIDEAIKRAQHSYPDFDIYLAEISGYMENEVRHSFCNLNVNNDSNIAFKGLASPNWNGWEPFVFNTDGTFAPSTNLKYSWDPYKANALSDVAKLLAQNGVKDFDWKDYKIAAIKGESTTPKIIFNPNGTDKSWKKITVGLYDDNLDVVWNPRPEHTNHEVIDRIQRAVQEYQTNFGSNKTLISAVGLAQNWVSVPTTTLRFVDNPALLTNWNVYLPDSWKGSSPKLLYTSSVFSFEWLSYLPVDNSPPIPQTKTFDPNTLIDVSEAYQLIKSSQYILKFDNLAFNGVELIYLDLVSSDSQPYWVFFQFDKRAQVIAVGAEIDGKKEVKVLNADQAGYWRSISCAELDSLTGFVPYIDEALKIAQHTYPKSTLSLAQVSGFTGTDGVFHCYCIINLDKSSHLTFHALLSPRWNGWESPIFHGTPYHSGSLLPFIWDVSKVRSVGEAYEFAAQTVGDFEWSEYLIDQNTDFDADRPMIRLVPKDVDDAKFDWVAVALYEDDNTTKVGWKNGEGGSDGQINFPWNDS